MIKNIEDLKKIQIVCKNQEQVKNCLNYIKQLGLDVDYYDCENYLIVFYDTSFDGFLTSYELEKKYVEFYNKEFVKTLQKFIKEKEEKEKKQELQDFEVASDGRITKINNQMSKKQIFLLFFRLSSAINRFSQDCLIKYVNSGFVYATEEARDKAMFKSKIETKLKNIAERLNNGRKIYWKNSLQEKFFIYYDYDDEELDCDFRLTLKVQGVIYCLDKNFLEVAKQEIGEENLKWYLQQSY